MSMQSFAQCDYTVDYTENPNNPLELNLYILGGIQDSSDVVTWDLGDNTTANGWYVVHQFPQAGQYTVVATIESSTCGSIATTSYIFIDSVNTTCDVSFDYVYLGQNNVSFNGYGNGYTPNDTWEWSFGDSTFATGDNVTHQFPAEGDYFVTLTATNVECGEMSVTQQVYVYNDTVNDCSVDFYYFVQPDMSVDFYGLGNGYTPNDTWIWSFSDSITATGQNVVHQFASEGEYTITLTAENNQCGMLSTTQQIFVFTDTLNDCSAYFNFMLDSTDLNTVYFFNQSYSPDSIVNYTWDFGDGSTSFEYNPYHTYSQEGEYLVTLTLEGAYCFSTYQAWVWVGDNNNWYPDDCQALFYSDYSQNGYHVNFYDLSYSGNEPILDWVWNFGDSSFSALQNPSHTYTQSGEYVVSLTIITANCVNTFEQVIYVENNSYNGDCQAFFYPVFDNTLTVQFFDLSMPEPNTWAWNFGDGTTSNLQNPTYSYSDTGVFTVTLETIAGDSCMSAFAMDIYFFEVQNSQKDVTYSAEILRSYAVQVPATSINYVKQDIEINVYPNPVTDLLNVNFGSFTTEAIVRILNINGQLLYNEVIDNQLESVIDVSNLNSGIYLLQVIENNQIKSVKFIK